MTERGMIFNGEMTRAILDGRKTQTRRPVKFPVHDKNLGCELAGNELAGELSAGNYLNSAFGRPGDCIWVRETWQAIYDSVDEFGHVEERTYAPSIPKENDNYWHIVYAEYFGNESREDRGFPWRPAIHMPRWASRILLEITDVRVERLKSISDGDAIREGCSTTDMKSGDCVADVFARLWASIYGSDSWNANPWVWVIEFKRVEGGAA